MKTVRTYILAGVAALALTSCNDYLTTVPKDAMSPSTTWKTSDDAEKFLVGCYDGWEDGGALLYWDAGSDFAYNNFPWEGFTNIGNWLALAFFSGLVVLRLYHHWTMQHLP